MTNEEIITACYRALLDREPDEDGLAQHSRALRNGLSELPEIIRSFLECVEFTSLQRKKLALSALGDAAVTIEDHSQFGEFRLMLNLLINEGACSRLIVDVGARGKDRSNSYDFLKNFGWRGLLIEANPYLIDQISKDFAGLDYNLVNVAVSDFDGSADFHFGINDDVSSLSSELAGNWGTSPGSVKVEVQRLGSLLLANGIPPVFDLLSIDIEGEDLRVLEDLIASTDYRPKWIIIEASHNFRFTSLEQLGVSASVVSNYRVADQTAANLILRSTDC